MLLKAPGFTVIAIFTLALGIGANSAIFSVVDTVLLRPLPFKNPEQLVMIWAHSSQNPEEKDVASHPDFLDYKEQSQSFTSMANYTRAGTVLSGVGESQELEGIAVSSTIFEVLGVQPLLGRGYTADEDKTGAAPVVVLSYGLWKRAFGSDPKIVGQQVMLSRRSHTVLGVMPPGWKFPVVAEEVDYVTPLVPLIQAAATNRGSHSLSIVARLKPGGTLRQAEAEMNTIAARLAQQYPDTNTDRLISLVPLHEDIVGDVRPALLVLLAAVALVSLIACANVANLLLARAAVRSREMAIRTALGAGRMRIVRQLLAESLLLAVMGGCAGLLVASWGVDLLSALGPRDLPRISEVGINVSVCLFTLGISVLSTVAFGLVPALQASRGDVNEALQHGSKGSTSGRGNRIRSTLVISQVALSLLLLAGAGLLIKSFINLRATNPGFDPTKVLIMDLAVPRVKYPEAEKQIQFYAQLFPKLAALPGVQVVGGVNPMPFSGNSRGSTFFVAGQPPIPKGNHPAASHLTVVPGYFQAMSIPLLAGRVFNERDNKDAPKVVIVNEAFARKFLLKGNPIGQRVLIDRPEPEPFVCEVVGVVGDTRHDTLREPPAPEFYVPFPQNPERRVYLIFRTSLTNLDAQVARAVHEIDPDVFVPQLEPMQHLLSASLAEPRFNMILLGVFAGVALVLAAVGIYGVIAYSVTQRTKEIGIRMALGAQRADMLRMILRQSLGLVVIGLVIGLATAFAVTRLLASLLYGVGANDISIYLGVIFLLGAAALVASFVPARRAMKVNPIVALHYE
jgi:putative ABC transport system permease protein